MIEGFMSVNTVVPVVIFRFVSAVCCLISVHVEDHWVYCFEISLQSLLV